MPLLSFPSSYSCCGVVGTGVKMSPLRATLHNLSAIGLAIVYAVIVEIYDQLGVYRNLFCTTKDGSIVLLVVSMAQVIPS